MNVSLLKYSFYDQAKRTQSHSTSLKSLTIASLAILFIVLLSYVVKAQTYPSGFNQVIVASGIADPTVMAFSPDGRIWVAQQTGQLRIVQNGSLLSTPFISLSVNSSGERGLLGIAFDPAFATNNYVYLYYTVSSGANNRISRFTANGNVVVPGSEVIILNLDPLGSATNHNGGTMQFGPDGKLYVGIGENANTAHAQNLDTYHGKIIRINSNGTIPSGNPYTTGSTQRRSVWAYGLRNPYTLTFQPGTGKLFVNDVGQNAWEEINDATTGGKNFGWPTAEGNSTNTAFTNPFYSYAHGSSIGQGCAITGGTFFNPTSSNYPSTYTGRYFYIDYCGNWMDMLTLSGSTATRTNFASNIAGFPVSLITGSDGNLYFLSRSNNSLYKITYTSGQAPVITNQPQSITVAQGGNATFSVTATGTPPLAYQWRKNGTNISGATSSTYTISSVTAGNAGTFSVVVSNASGTVTSNNATLTVTQPNQAPNATISTPAAGATYAAGTSISYSGSATDPEDGTLAASAFTWYVVFYHDTHNHPGPSAPDGVQSGTFAIPNSGETATNVFYRLYLVVTDSQGAKDTTYTDILPRTSTITLNTVPQGLQVTLDGQPFTAPYTLTSVEGILRSIGVTSPQTLNSNTYTFSNWSQGGSQTQTIATPVNDIVYTVTFTTPSTITTLTPVADAQVRVGSFANTNYGTLQTMSTLNSSKASATHQSYIRFNISALGASSASVKLRLYGALTNTYISTITTQVFNVTSQAWSENSITYNSGPAAQTTVIASKNINGTTAMYYDFDVTSHINSLRASGATSVSFLIKNLTASRKTITTFNSKESANNKPELQATSNSPRLSSGEDDDIISEDHYSDVAINVYPNPVKDIFTVSFTPALTKGFIQVVDINGKVILEQAVYETSQEQFDATLLKSGIYYIITETGIKKYTNRIVIRN